MTTSADAFEQFQQVKKQFWPDLWAGRLDDEEVASDEEKRKPLFPEDLEKRANARRQILSAWRAYVTEVGADQWNQI